MAAAEVLRIVGVDELHVQPELGEGVKEQVVGAAVEVGGRDDLVARPGDVQD